MGSRDYIQVSYLSPKMHLKIYVISGYVDPCNLRKKILPTIHMSLSPLIVILLSCLVVSIEDAFDQDDWDAWSKLTSKVDIQIVGLVSDNLMSGFTFPCLFQSVYM